MANRFLGLDSINVLKKYIDDQVALLANKSNLITLQAYKYVVNNAEVQAPTGGTYSPIGADIEYPDGWASLQKVLDDIGDTAALENALASGSIWMSVGMAKGVNRFTDWSDPIKISGQNGVSVQFKYTYSDSSTLTSTEIEALSNYPLELNNEHRKVYVWARYAGEDWVGPRLWSNYAVDASDVYYRYKVTAEPSQPTPPESDNDSTWMNSAAISLSNEYPYMWMSSKRVTVNNSGGWTEPILFGHYAQDGKDGAAGKDGVKPNYSVTLYCASGSVEAQPIFTIPNDSNAVLKLDSLMSLNDDWTTTPEYNAGEVCWCIVLNFNGEDDSLNEYSGVYRFSALDGECTSCVRTLYKFYWSSEQTLPTDLTENDWQYYPYQNEEDINGSLWMIMGIHQLDTVNNTPTLIGEWSDPVKLSGPQGLKGDTGEQGPQGPQGLKGDTGVVDKRINLNLFDDTNIDPDNTDVIIVEIDGYTAFTEGHSYISNSANEVTYYVNMHYDEYNAGELAGYTIKIANIGTNRVFVTNNTDGNLSNKYVFAGSCTLVPSFVLEPNETVELICYEDKLLVLGKSLLVSKEEETGSNSGSNSGEIIDDTTGDNKHENNNEADDPIPVQPDDQLGNIIYYTSTDDKIVVPSDSDAFGSALISNTYDNKKNMYAMGFENSIDLISEGAFAGCDNLQSVTLPNSVNYIGARAFECSNLDSITLLTNGIVCLGDPFESATILSVFGGIHQLNPNFTIYVPDEYLVDYKNHDSWKVVADRIKSIDTNE